MGKNRNRNTGSETPVNEQAPSLQDQLVAALEENTADESDSILTEEELAALKEGHAEGPDGSGVTIHAEKLEIEGEVIANPPADLADLKQVIDPTGTAIGVDTAGEATDATNGGEGDKPPVDEQADPEVPQGGGEGGDINVIDLPPASIDKIEIPEFVAPEIPEAPVPGPEDETDDTEEEPADSAEPEPEAPAVRYSDEELRRKLKGVLEDDALEAWDYDSLYLFETKQVLPHRTPRGEWPVDIRRKRNIKAWTANSLLDWVDGNIKTPKGVDEDDIYAELYRRNKLPGNWSREDAIEYVKTGKKPGYTKHGVLIKDSMRDGAPVSHWTHLELRSALLDEIGSPHSKEEMVDALRKRLGLKDTFSARRLLDTLEESPTEANMNNTLLKSKLEEFRTVMIKPAVHLTEKSAGDAHKALWQTLRDVIRREPAEFHEGWNIVLNFVNDNYNTLFLMERRHRGWSMISLSKSALTTYEYLLTLMVETRAPNARSNPGTCNLNTILRYVTNEQERSNIIHFYTPE
jgi:hypothetical protein